MNPVEPSTAAIRRLASSRVAGGIADQERPVGAGDQRGRAPGGSSSGTRRSVDAASRAPAAPRPRASSPSTSSRDRRTPGRPRSVPVRAGRRSPRGPRSTTASRLERRPMTSPIALIAGELGETVAEVPLEAPRTRPPVEARLVGPRDPGRGGAGHGIGPPGPEAQRPERAATARPIAGPASAAIAVTTLRSAARNAPPAAVAPTAPITRSSARSAATTRLPPPAPRPSHAHRPRRPRPVQRSRSRRPRRRFPPRPARR